MPKDVPNVCVFPIYVVDVECVQCIPVVDVVDASLVPKTVPSSVLPIVY